ncbi:winged helix-turn-helix transcriptional regulator [Paracoccus methylarcula]|uniref:Transcriptional regulator n=1 Tax=Paracoccus methylarcula TaxID=72022 RepID=A0A3R7LIY2_9RHOB|nr:helix-turn-helix domain-containing protein [Paracoccus methylarcula]RNF33548.1 transcriptional regulator [Paracoccus methylarcula]
MKWSELEQETCSMARTLSVIGDRWTLLILRDCFLGVRRFDDFHERLGVTRGILADRLKQLSKAGVLKKVAYQEHPPRHEYKLTGKGLDLYPVILSIVHWGDVHMAGEDGRPVLHQHMACGHAFDPRMVCSECGTTLSPHDVKVLQGPGKAADRNLPVRPAGKMAQS